MGLVPGAARIRLIDRSIERGHTADVATANALRSFSKAILDFLKNLALLGALKFFAQRTNSQLMEFAFYAGGIAFVILGMSYLQPWRVRIFSAFARRPTLESLDFLLNVAG